MMKYSLIDIICSYYYNSENIVSTKCFSQLHTDEGMKITKIFSSSKSMKSNPYKTIGLITFLFIIILSLPQFKSVQAETHKIPGKCFRGDIQHTGQSAYKGPQTNNLKWSFKIGTRITSSLRQLGRMALSMLVLLMAGCMLSTRMVLQNGLFRWAAK